MKKALRVLAFLAVTALLAVIFPWTAERFTRRQEAPPPGVSVPKAQVLTVWLLGDGMNGMGYLKNQAAAFEKENPGMRVYLRMAAAQELTAPDAVPPDVVVFRPGDLPSPEGLLCPLPEPDLMDGALRAGKWREQLYAVPIALSGYVLAVDSAYAPKGQAAETPAPSLWEGRMKSPAAEEAPQAAEDTELPWKELAKSFTAAAQKGKRKTAATYAFQTPPGAAQLLFSSLSEGRQNDLNAAALPEDFAVCTAKKAYSDFTSRACHGAMLTLNQWRSFQALVSAGKGFKAQAYAPAFAFTDLYLAAGVTAATEKSGQALSFVSRLTSRQGQEALAAYGLMTVLKDLRLYGGDTPLLFRLERLYGGELCLPNLFSYTKEQMESIGYSAWHQGGDLFSLTERML